MYKRQLLYVKQVSQPVSQISQQVNTILAAMAGAERIFAVMEAPVSYTHLDVYKRQAVNRVFSPRRRCSSGDRTSRI